MKRLALIRRAVTGHGPTRATAEDTDRRFWFVMKRGLGLITVTLAVCALPAIASASATACPQFIGHGAYYNVWRVSVRNMSCGTAQADINHARYPSGQITGWHRQVIANYYLGSSTTLGGQELRYFNGAHAFRFTWAT